jgi:transcriptional regulator with XRE-family HTH domain
MPFNFDAMYRRRMVLSISQHNLAIMAGLHPTTLSRIERGSLPNDGGGIGIDVMMRIAEALRMDYHELLIPPTGNRYQRAVRFAKEQQPMSAAPELHDLRRTIQAEGLRRVTRDVTPQDTQEIVDREETDAEPATMVGEEELTTEENPAFLKGLEHIRFQRDPSSE